MWVEEVDEEMQNLIFFQTITYSDGEFVFRRQKKLKKFVQMNSSLTK